uniref:Citrate transporter-like domain-containing protein n=1 Tax=Amphimedon queenslandica TaxID=400682 RepID=A0A1X7VK63_AMPQE
MAARSSIKLNCHPKSSLAARKVIQHNNRVAPRMEYFSNESSSSNATCSYDTNLYVQITGSILFVIVWPFVVLDMKWFPLGRPAAALVGAAFMVLFQIVSQNDVYAIQGHQDNLQTVFLLVGMMMLSYYYDREGILRVVMLRIFGENKPFLSILWKVCLMSAILSAFITNDAACLVVTPLILTEFIKQKRDRWELLPLCLGIATSANIGSAATIFGNPQNAFIASTARSSQQLY